MSAKTVALIDSIIDILDRIDVGVYKVMRNDHTIVRKIDSLRLGKSLVFSCTTILKKASLLKHEVILKVGKSGKIDEWTTIRTGKGILISPSIRDLDVYDLMDKLREIGVTEIKWDYSHAIEGMVDACVTVSLKKIYAIIGTKSLDLQNSFREPCVLNSQIIPPIIGKNIQKPVSPVMGFSFSSSSYMRPM